MCVKTQVKLLEVKAIHERPAVIRELVWQASFTDSSQRAESVGNILFKFYNGKLYHFVVTYDQERTEGMTAEDIVEAVSSTYGTATRPVAEIILSSSNFYGAGEKIISDQSQKVLARWEDSQYSFNLYQSSYPSTFGMVMYSKRLDALARTAIAKAVRPDDQEAPQRETALQNKRMRRTAPFKRKPGKRARLLFALK
jgi:hypothetical protein